MSSAKFEVWSLNYREGAKHLTMEVRSIQGLFKESKRMDSRGGGGGSDRGSYFIPK